MPKPSHPTSTRSYTTVDQAFREVAAGQLKPATPLEHFHFCLTEFGSCISSAYEPGNEAKTWVFARCQKDTNSCSVYTTKVWED